MARGVGAAEFDALENFGLGFFAEAVEAGDLAGKAGGFEFGDGFDAEFVVQGLDLFGADAGDLDHFEQAGRDGGFEFVVIGELAGGGEFGDFFLKASPMPLISPRRSSAMSLSSGSVRVSSARAALA